MTLRNRIAITFALVNFTLLAIIFIFLYFLTRRYTHNEFFTRLEERAQVAAQAFLEKDELNQQIFEDVRRRHLRTLYQEQEFFYSLDDSTLTAKALPEFLDTSILSRVREGEEVRYQYSQLSVVGMRYVDNQGIFAAVVAAQDIYGQRKLRNLLKLMLGTLGIALLVVFLLGRWYAWHILLPIGQMIRKMKSINSSNLHLRLPEKPGRQDELKQLASTFNRMLDRIEAAIETQNLFIGNASHQIKNPLTAIIGEVETAMLKERSPAEYRHSLKIIGEEADRLSALAKQLVRMSYPDAGEGQIAEWRFDELLLDLVEEFKELYPQANMSIEFSSLPPDPEKLLYRGYYNLIRIAIGNLLENAIKFSNNTTVKLKLLFTDKHLIVSISDNGIGIPEEAQAHIFTPFYRAENAKGFPGYGVGLALADKVVKMHDGRLSLSSSAENGTIFTLLLPF
ncbi:MAG: HAMP domain-containing histidine kinase [Phaeodactylibacter sp.]|nr:HAMP domain-containing histidine kinase [Phaeodactylibacter sp.]MCB9289706.1 HAMP domain-containing histidine kinase [Lewinellaceae bacterium]